MRVDFVFRSGVRWPRARGGVWITDVVRWGIIGQCATREGAAGTVERQLDRWRNRRCIIVSRWESNSSPEADRSELASELAPLAAFNAWLVKLVGQRPKSNYIVAQPSNERDEESTWLGVVNRDRMLIKSHVTGEAERRWPARNREKLENTRETWRDIARDMDMVSYYGGNWDCGKFSEGGKCSSILRVCGGRQFSTAAAEDRFVDSDPKARSLISMSGRIHT